MRKLLLFFFALLIFSGPADGQRKFNRKSASFAPPLQLGIHWMRFFYLAGKEEDRNGSMKYKINVLPPPFHYF
jgi:hypothetical protein